VLKELSKVEQRYDAVMAIVRDGLSVVQVAAKYQVTRQSFYRWIAWYEQGGLEALADRPHRPKRVPHQMAPAIEARVCELRRWRPYWGPVTIAHRLAWPWVRAPPRSGRYRRRV
jgi:transposase